MTEILEIIGRLSFRFAKSMPQTPHEYTVRKPDQPEAEADYVALWTACQESPIVERYARRKKPYLYPGDGWKYWHMGPLYQSIIINRMKIEDDWPRLVSEGQPRRDANGQIIGEPSALLRIIQEIGGIISTVAMKTRHKRFAVKRFLKAAHLL